MNLADIKQLFDYTEWANHLALDAAAKVPLDQLKANVNISHKSIRGTLIHTASAEWVWLERWKGTSPTQFWEEEQYPDVAAIRARWAEIENDRRQYLETLADADLYNDLTFRRLNGEPMTMPIGSQMQHVVNHSTLHRGQVVGMIRQLGMIPPETDLLFYLRAEKYRG